MGRPASSTPPNILLLFTDQQRADTIGALGNRLIRTPHLDRLAAEGTAFDRAYTPSPVCVPARHALITGLPPHRTGVVDNVESNGEGDSFMSALAAAGYQTHGAGKMHFCGDPRRAWGFESRDYSEELDDGDEYRAFLRARGYGHVLDPMGLRSEYYYLPQPSQLPAPLHHTTWVADRSIDFLRRRDRSRPFFLWSSFIKPHPPFETPNPWGRLYRSPDMPDPIPAPPEAVGLPFWNRVQNRYKYMDGGGNPSLLRTQRAAYYASISFIDHHVGRILAELGKDLERTLVVFSSDHGEMLGDFGCFGKRCMRDAAARVPLLVRHPRWFAAGARCGSPVSLLDLFPTFTAAAGLSQPPPDPDSRPLMEVVAQPNRARIVCSQFSERSLGLYLAIDGAWKYIRSAADRREWLYHVAEDPDELTDRASDPAARPHLERLRGFLLRRFERDGDTFAVADGAWRDYGVTTVKGGSRDGVLFQDPPGLEPGLAGLGPYAPGPAQPKPDLISVTLPTALDPRTGAVRPGNGLVENRP